jgi:putative ABC transport system substrate-binding protein
MGRFETLLSRRHGSDRYSAHVPPADLDIPVLGQLPPTHLPLGNAFEPGRLEIVRLDAPLGGWPVGQEPLEDAPRDPDHAAVLPDLDPEHYGLPIGVSAAIIRDGEEYHLASRKLGGTRMRRREFLLSATATMAARAARAQQKAMPAVGYLQSAGPGPSAPYLAALRQGLSEAGYIEGQNLTIEYRWADGDYDRLPALATELVHRKVDVIMTGGGPPAALAAKAATSTIPIVFVVGTDPVGLGLVASLARPGGNLTGMSMLMTELNPKRVELLSELVPQARVIGLLVNPEYSGTPEMIREVQEAARAKELQLHVGKAGTEAEIDAAVASFVQLRVGGLVVGNDTFFYNRREQVVALASRDAIPAIYGWRDFVSVGGLMSYGTSIASAYRQAGAYLGRILAGVKPADLPVQQPTNFELVINLKTAKALGLTVPPSILARADEVIE